MPILLEELKSSPKKFHIFNACLKIVGGDAESYLNSQTTNSVLKLKDNDFQFNCLLDGAGKLVSTFVLCRENIETYYLLVNESYLEETFERIEKFHISEDFEVEKVKINTYLNTHSQVEGFKGQYFFEDDSICLSESVEESDGGLSLYQSLFGIQNFGEDLKPGELINNTRFDELAVDYKKGCYPGQETVSKIHTRRGAAFKPVIIIVDNELKIDSDLINGGKRIAKYHKAHILDGKTYISASVGREVRVENLKIYFQIDGQEYEGTIHLHPFISSSKKDIATEFYDEAVSIFQSGDDQRALQLFKTSIELNPTYEDAYESLGVLYGRLGDFDKAIELMKKLKELNPKCMMALTNLSLYHMKVGDIETAEKFKADATLLNFQLLGDEADQKRKAEEIEQKRLAERDKREAMFKQVLDIDPVDAMANNGLGEIAYERSEYTSAKDFFTKALEGDQKYSVAYLGLGKSLVELNELDDAKEILAKGVAIASKNGDMMPANEMQAIILRIS